MTKCSMKHHKMAWITAPVWFSLWLTNWLQLRVAAPECLPMAQRFRSFEVKPASFPSVLNNSLLTLRNRRLANLYCTTHKCTFLGTCCQCHSIFGHIIACFNKRLKCFWDMQQYFIAHDFPLINYHNAYHCGEKLELYIVSSLCG